jgi:aconitate hydratase
MVPLIQAGARIHQAGCNGCIGMGQAPATDKISLRTVPRNFPGRSGTNEDKVYLCSPETAAAAALTGVITDPRDLAKKMGIAYPHYKEPSKILLDLNMVYPPPQDGSQVEIIRGPNIQPLPKTGALKDHLEGPVLLKLENNVSTDEISPAGSKVLPFRSNIPEISKFTFSRVDPTFYQRAMQHQSSGSFLVAGVNYGQGSSREHAALAPSFLGVKAVLVKSYARIHRSNLINFGILPLTFEKEESWKEIDQGDILSIHHVIESIKKGDLIYVENKTKNKKIPARCILTPHEREILIQGGLINHIIKERAGTT